MTCRERFWKNTEKALEMFENIWETSTNTKFEDIKDIIRGKIYFECKNHLGQIIPQYYTYGFPSLLWTCKKCLEKCV